MSTGRFPERVEAVPRLDLSLVIPAFNETGRLAEPIREAAYWCRSRGQSFEIIVSDDGSSDGTADLVDRLTRDTPELRLVRSQENRGKGHAVRLGVHAARGELILVADADGATPIAELARLERHIHAGADLAIGSRGLRGEGHTVRRRWYRHLVGRAFHSLVRIVGVRGLKDTQCGFKLFRARAAHELFSRSRVDGFSFDVEILLLAQQLGYQIDEVPVSWTHQPGSRVNLVTDSAHMAFDLARIRLRLLFAPAKKSLSDA